MGIVYQWNSMNGGGGVATYPTAADFPSGVADGTLAVALDSLSLYVFDSGSMTWLALSAPSSVLSIGTIDSQAPSANGATLNIHALIMQSASVSVPGLMNLATQSFAGNKTFTGTIGASNLSGTNTGDISLGTASGLSLSGQILSLQLSDATHTGALSSTDWSTFNSKQAAGSYITALTGGVTASGPGSAVATVITNANLTGPITSIGNATSIASQTGTGSTFVMNNSPTLITPVIGAATGTSLSLSSLIASRAMITDGSDNLISSVTTSTELSYVNGVTSSIQTQLNAKQPSGSYITALTGDITATGPGSAVATIAPLVVTNAKIANTTIDLTTKVTGQLPQANIASIQVNKYFYVDGQRTDSYTADGSIQRPFKTISASISQVITNADNSINPYTIVVQPGGYNETLTFNSSLLFSLSFSAPAGASFGPGTGNAIVSTSNNTQLATLSFSNFIINGGLNLIGDINNTNFASVELIFTSCDFNFTSSFGIIATNLNNLYFYGGQLQGSSAVFAFTNIAFAYIQGAEGDKSGTTINLVQNNAGNQPSQSSGNYLLLSETKANGTLTIDAGSELDSIQSYFGSVSSITNNGIIHSFSDSYNGTITLNSGSSSRFRGSIFLTQPTVNGGATVTYQGHTGYQPVTTANWNSIPVSLDGALNTLATSGIVKSQTQNLFLASPNGSSGLPGFRSIVSADLPGGTGTVTSVAMTVPSFLSISGSPITTSGTLGLTLSGTALPTSSGGTGNTTPYTSGSVIFADGSGNLSQDHTNFNWDDTAHRLSLGGHLSTAMIGLSVAGSDIGLDVNSIASNTAFQVSNQGAQIAAQFINSTNSATQGAAFGGAFSRGTIASRLQSLAGDQLTTFSAQGYTGSAFGPGFSGAIAFIATENTTSTHNGGEIVIATTPNGSLAPVAALILGQNQLLQLPAYTTTGFLHTDTSGNVTTFTPAQTNAVLPVFTSTLNGLAPLSGGGTINFLRADGTWVAPAQLLPAEERITLSGTDITNQYVDLAFPIYGVSASSNSASLTPYRGPLQLKTVDYTVSLTGGTAGVTRITFAGDLATGGAAALIAGNILIITYMH